MCNSKIICLELGCGLQGSVTPILGSISRWIVREYILAIHTKCCFRPSGSLIPSVALLPLINVLSQNSDKMIDTQHATAPSEAGDASQQLLSSQQLTNRVAASAQAPCLTGQSAMTVSHNNWSQPPVSAQPQPQQHLSMPMFL